MGELVMADRVSASILSPLVRLMPRQLGAERIIFDGKHGPFNYSVDEDDHVVLHEQTITQLGSIRAIHAYLKPASFAVPPLVIAD
jgi:hypothetical protein